VGVEIVHSHIKDVIHSLGNWRAERSLMGYHSFREETNNDGYVDIEEIEEQIPSVIIFP
jgi:hypothetical protein